MRKNFFIPACAFLLFWDPHVSFAIMASQCQDIKYVSSQATLIVRGQVVDVRSKREGDRKIYNIYTLVQIKVDEYVRGKGPQPVVIKQFGGQIEENGQIIQISDGDTPVFKVGESGYLYLEKPDTPFYGGQFYTTVCLSGINEFGPPEDPGHAP